MEFMNLHGLGGVSNRMKIGRALLTIRWAVKMEYLHAC